MQFGLLIRGQHSLGEDIAARARDDLEMARRAEQLGFASVARGSHYSSHPLLGLQQIPFVAQVAAIAPSLRLIPGVVLLALHKPLDVAEQIATLDVMSGGKVVFGCGIG
jgi:alkanesulfonate monooxygenase SsuD/methylene tetrahydromethanopterin reductase-like flavin-dependent oxidoreductase (luciferase family)